MSQRLANGLLIKGRHAYPNPVLMLRALRQPKSPDCEVRLSARIVVIGLGTAALGCLRELKKEGFTNVTIVSRDQLFGGKCVNCGCMPSEFVFAHEGVSVEQRRVSLEAFVSDLRNDVRKQFDELGFPVVVGEVEGIDGSRIQLSNGESLEFDRAIVAMGNDYPLPDRIPADLPKLTPIEQFWHLPAGSRVVIYADGNVFASSLGEIAQRLGMLPTVLLAGANPFAGLPSYRYYTREMGRRGVTLHERARLIRADENELVFEANGKRATIPYDHLVVLSKPIPRFPKIDGVQPSVYDIDLTCGSLPTRPDIVFVGDGAGLFTASAAENQAKLLMRYWKHGERLDLVALDATPLCLHGAQSLALAGPAWTYTSRRWNEIDFRSLGWSKIHGLEGKLWYLFDEKSGRITGLQICHKHASELICLGAALMEFPVWDLKWVTIALHPTSAEIFKVVAERAAAQFTGRGKAVSLIDDTTTELTFQLPATIDLHPGDSLPEWLTREQCLKAITSRQPREYFAACYGLARLATVAGEEIPFRLRSASDGGMELIEPCDVQMCYDAPTQVCVIERGKFRVVVDYHHGGRRASPSNARADLTGAHRTEA